jgi:CubicO group peptidase (beta-lactamase class C family)
MISFTKRSLRFSLFFILLGFLAVSGCKNPQVKGEGGEEVEEPYSEVYPKFAVLTGSKALVADSLRHHFDKLGKAGFNGTVLFAENGEVIFSKAYGYCNLKTKEPLAMESAFQLASVSKPITALAVLVLKDEGKLAIDDSVRKYIPELPYPGITIRHLLTHRSGLPNYMYFSEDDWLNKSIPLTNKDVIDLMATHQYKPYYLPDKRYNYSNTNYALLAYIVEKVSGMPFEDFVTKKIFKPCGMRYASIYNKSRDTVNPNKVVGYPSRSWEAENSYQNGVVGDKGVYCSAYDLLMLDQALYTNKPVTQATLAEAFTPQHKDLRPNDNYGLGWRLDVTEPWNKVIYHTGWWKGFRSYFIRETGEHRTIIVLTNTPRASRFNTHELRERF